LHTWVGEGHVPASPLHEQAELPMVGHWLMELAQEPAGVPDEQEKHSVLRFSPSGAQLEQSDTHCPFELRIVPL
jgi:hypothetical protein